MLGIGRGKGRGRGAHAIWAVGGHGCCEDDGTFDATIDPGLGDGCGAVVGTEDLGDCLVG